MGQSIGLGGDINDLQFLKEPARKYVLCSAFPEVIRTAGEEGWYISKDSHFDGSNEILEQILAL